MVKWSPESVLPILDKKFERIFLDSDFTLFEDVWEQSDKGDLNELQLIEKISTLAGISLDKAEHALKMLKQSLILNKPMSDLLASLHESGYNLFCLSNISKSFGDYLIDRYEFFNYFTGIVFSYEEKCIKPDLQIYNNLISKFSLSTENTIFIDDKLENIKSAQSLGIKSFHYRDHTVFLNELSNILPSDFIMPE